MCLTLGKRNRSIFFPAAMKNNWKYFYIIYFPLFGEIMHFAINRSLGSPEFIGGASNPKSQKEETKICWATLRLLYAHLLVGGDTICQDPSQAFALLKIKSNLKPLNQDSKYCQRLGGTFMRGITGPSCNLYALCKPITSSQHHLHGMQGKEKWGDRTNHRNCKLEVLPSLIILRVKKIRMERDTVHRGG